MGVPEQIVLVSGLQNDGGLGVFYTSNPRQGQMSVFIGKDLQFLGLLIEERLQDSLSCQPFLSPK